MKTYDEKFIGAEEVQGTAAPASQEVYKARICWQKTVNSGKPEPCPKERFKILAESPKVKNTCEQLAKLNPRMQDYHERKNALKKQLPILIPHACAFGGNGTRTNNNAVPSGLGMLDFDNIQDPKALFDYCFSGFAKEKKIYFASITPSGKGLRLIFELEPGESIVEGQKRIGSLCSSICDYDRSVKDLSRASYMVPIDYILYMDDGLFDVKKIHNTIEEKKKAEKPEILDKGYAPLSEEKISELVTMLIQEEGGMPEIGNRNNTYFKVARKLANLCHYSIEAIFQMMPDWGLPAEERKGICERVVKYAEEGREATVAELDEVSQENPFWGKSNEMKVPANMPMVFKILCSKVEDRFKPAMVASMLPALGTLATDARFYYAGREQSFSFMTVVTGPAASGKAFYTNALDLVMSEIEAQDEKEWAKERAYKEELKMKRNKSSQPENPHAAPRILSAKVSDAALVQLLTYANGKHLFLHSEELDSSTNNTNQRWGVKSDVFRSAFDNGKYGNYTLNEVSTNGVAKVYMNTLFAGTFNSVLRHFPDVEDGTITRFLFAKLPDMAFTKRPEAIYYTPKEQEEISRYCHQLYTCGKVQLRCKAVEDAIDKWLEFIRLNAMRIDSRTVDQLSHRSAVIGYRAGMLAYLLERQQNKKSCGDFAVWVASYCLATQMELWGNKIDMMAKAQRNFGTYTGPVKSVLDLLPLKFSKEQFIVASAQLKQSTSADSIRKKLNRYMESKLIIKLADNLYQKMDRY